MLRVLALATVFVVSAATTIACSDGTEAAALCGAQECPVGTAFSETRTSAMTYDISGGFDPLTYDAEGSFKSFGTGSCEFFCSVIQACPDGTFPVITKSCFTCGILIDEGDIAQGDCDGSGSGIRGAPDLASINNPSGSFAFFNYAQVRHAA